VENPVAIKKTYRRKDSIRQSQQFLNIMKFYCNMFRLTYKEPSSG